MSFARHEKKSSSKAAFGEAGLESDELDEERAEGGGTDQSSLSTDLLIGLVGLLQPAANPVGWTVTEKLYDIARLSSSGRSSPNGSPAPSSDFVAANPVRTGADAQNKGVGRGSTDEAVGGGENITGPFPTSEMGVLVSSPLFVK